MADFDASVSEVVVSISLGSSSPCSRLRSEDLALTGGSIVYTRIVGIVFLVAIGFPRLLISQTTQTAKPAGPYARIAIMRALDGHTVDWEAGYIRHLEW